MTLIAGFKRWRNVVIAQDAAFVNGATGRMEGIGSKSISIHGVPAVIGFTGAVPSAQGVAYFADRANRLLRHDCTLSDLLHAIPDIAGDAIACRLTIGAWDRKQREGRLFTYANRESLAVPGLRAGDLVEAEMLLGVSFEPAEVLGEGFDLALTDAQLVEIFEGQRQRLAPPADQAGAPCHSVGVLLTCLNIGRRGISERSIWRWDDRMGEPIKPTRGEAFDIRTHGHLLQRHNPAVRAPELVGA